MKVIILTQYFPPETGAPQNRLSAIARDLASSGAEVTVLTGMPNYPEMQIQEGYRRKVHLREEIDGYTIHRAWLYVSKGRGMIARLMNYFSFVFTSLFIGLFKLRRADILFVESPPLFLGITAIVLARAKSAKLVFNVSDLWPESAVQLGLVKNRTVIRLSEWLEMKCYRRSALITGQTKGIVRNINSRCPGKKVLWLPNGVDLEAVSGAKMDTGARSRHGLPENTLLITYAGIIGHAQGLEVIIRAAAELRGRNVTFVLIGDGPVKQELKDLAAELNVIDGVRFIDRIPRAEVLSIVRNGDAVVVPLKRNDLFKGAIPSKIFEAMALERPILLGVDGEARELFIDEGKGGLYFTPEDHKDLARSILIYLNDPRRMEDDGRNGSRYVRQNFERRTINMRLFHALKEMVG